jgi:hypothetical protein
MQFVYLGLACRMRHFRGTGERRVHPLDRLVLPGRNHHVMDAVLGAEFRQRQITMCGLERNTVHEISRIPFPRRLFITQSLSSERS